MSRRSQGVQPTTLQRLRSREEDRKAATAAEALRGALGALADVREPSEAEPPILAPTVRQALFAWLAEIRAKDELAAVGVKPRTTALLFGPPGCGKTTLTHHLAARLGVPLVVVGSEMIVDQWMGSTERNVGRLFDGLKAAETPCVVLIDEIEGIGGNRARNTHGGADNARTSIMGVLLRRVEEFEGFLVGATNRPEDLDPALWRRFHMQISVALPGDEERFAIMRRYGLPFQIDDDDLDALVDATAGASPALLRGVMEGLKRTLVIGPKIGVDVSNAASVLASVVSSVQPPPEIKLPPLWANKSLCLRIAPAQWPPALPSDEKDEAA